MAAFSIDSNPDLNTTHVEQVKESDFVIASFVNPYYQTFLQNDRALYNMINSMSKTMDDKISKAALTEVSATEIDDEIKKFN